MKYSNTYSLHHTSVTYLLCVIMQTDTTYYYYINPLAASYTHFKFSNSVVLTQAFKITYDHSQVQYKLMYIQNLFSKLCSVRATYE